MENFPAITNDNQVQVSLDTDIETFTSLVEASATMTKMEPVISLTAEYISLEKPGESFRGIFIGYQKISKLNQGTGEMQDMEAAKFVMNRKVVINSGVALVTDLKRANVQHGTPLEIVYKEKNGNTKVYSINLLGEKAKK